MYIHLNGFDFEFSKQAISSFINNDNYQDQSSDIAGIHLADIYQQMNHAGVDKIELIAAILNYHISILHEEGISINAIKQADYPAVNVSFLVDLQSDSIARFLNYNNNVTEDTILINIRNFNRSFKLTYSELIQLEESYRNNTPEQLLLLFLESFKIIRDTKIKSQQQQHYAILISTGLLLFNKQLNILDVIEFTEIEFELNSDRLLLNLLAGLDTCLFEFAFNSDD